jgi:hypothetical protein
LSYSAFIHPPMGSTAIAGENPCATCGLTKILACQRQGPIIGRQAR